MRADAAMDAPTHHTCSALALRPHCYAVSRPCFAQSKCYPLCPHSSANLFFFSRLAFSLFNLPVAVSAASGGAMVKTPARVACEGRSHGEQGNTCLVEVMISHGYLWPRRTTECYKVTTFGWGACVAKFRKSLRVDCFEMQHAECEADNPPHVLSPTTKQRSHHVHAHVPVCSHGSNFASLVASMRGISAGICAGHDLLL